MAMTCVRIPFLIRESGRRLISSSRPIIYSRKLNDPGANCDCDISSLTSLKPQRTLSLGQTRGLRTCVVSFFQLNPRTAAAAAASKASPSVEDVKDIDSEKTLPLLNEMMKRQKRLLEEPDEKEPYTIYEGILSGQIKRLKFFSMGTSIMGIMMQPMLLKQAGEVPLAASIAVMGSVGFFTFITPFLIHLLAKKYVTEMVYDPLKDTYKITTYTFFVQKREVEFKIDDVKVPDVPGPFTTFTLKTKDGKYAPYFVTPEAFLRPTHYGRLMGYDKPIDLRLNEENKDKNKKPEGSSSTS